MITIYPSSFSNSTYMYNLKKKNYDTIIHSQAEAVAIAPSKYYQKDVYNKEKLLEDPKHATEYFEYNYSKQKPLFGKAEDIKLIETNEKIKQNFCQFLVDKSDAEIKELSKKKHLSPEEKEKLEGFKQINNFFDEYLELLKEDKVKPLSFTGELSADDESFYKNFVHLAAGACSLVSAAAGATSFGFTDTPILRGIQMFMFYVMQQDLKVPFFASAEYVAKELYQGAILGLEGARILTDIAGGAAHVVSVISGASTASGGSSHAAIAKTQAVIHGSLSFAITEKMGRGYIKRVKNNQMNFKDQFIEIGQFLAFKALFGGGLSDIFDTDSMPTIEDASSPEAIKKAYESLPSETREFMGNIAGLLKNFDTQKLGISFAIQFGTSCLMTKHEHRNYKKILQNAFKNSFIMTAIYDLYDYQIGELVSNDAKRAITELQENLEQYPEVYRVFKNSEAEFFANMDLDKLDTHEFQKLFKNPTFITYAASTSTGMLKEFIKACSLRNLAGLQKTTDKLVKEKEKLKNIENFLNKQRKNGQEVTKIIQNVNSEQKNLMNSKNNFGYGRIGGYETQKGALNLQFINSVAMEKHMPDIYPPSALLFYGPTNTGKTTMAMALTEQSQSKLRTIKPFISETKFIKKIQDWEQLALEDFQTKKQRTIIQIDEIEGLVNKPKALEKITEIIQNEDSRITIIGTTNSPELIPQSFSRYFQSFYFGPAKTEDITQICNKFLDEKHKNFEKLITDTLNSNNLGKYSNKQIVDIIKEINNKNITSTEKIVQYIKSITPEILNDDIKKYEGL